MCRSRDSGDNEQRLPMGSDPLGGLSSIVSGFDVRRLQRITICHANVCVASELNKRRDITVGDFDLVYKLLE